uniref:Uncharacterized protein n=1 Tax=Candidatus Nitrotoga fabula TaxID=2182327 RepID=A0A2X0SDR0_9PROT|nr:protein of unknown function [Candidatus Nitrotoga fabula]
MNQAIPSLQAQRISVLPDPQVSVNVKLAYQERAMKRNQGEQYPELRYINPLTNDVVDDHVRDLVNDIVAMLSTNEPVSQKTAMAVIFHSIERIHYSNQQQGIQ